VSISATNGHAGAKSGDGDQQRWVTMYYRTVNAADRQGAAGCKFPGRLTVGTLSALVLGSYLLIAHPIPSTAPTPPSVVGAPLSIRFNTVPLGSYATSTPNPTVALEDAKPMSTIDLLVAVFGSVLALAWAMIGAWLGARRETPQTPVNKLVRDRTETTALKVGSADAALRRPTYGGMRCYAEVASKAVGDGGMTRIG
jgi:hypothetical protein